MPGSDLVTTASTGDERGRVAAGPDLVPAVPFELLPVALWALDETAERILAANEAALELAALSRDEIVGRRPEELVAEEEAAALRTYLRDRIRRGDSPLDPKPVWSHRVGTSGHAEVEIHLQPLRDTSPLEWLAIVVDVRGRRRAEVILREMRSRFDQLIGQVPASLWTTDDKLNFTWAAGGALRVRDTELVGKSLQEFLGPGDSTELAVRCHREALQGENRSYPFAWKHRHFEVHVAPLRTGGDRIEGVIGVAIDVTARRRDEREILDSREQLRVLAQRLQTVREEEQTRISREIHDQIGSNLSLVRLELTRVRDRLTWRQKDVLAIVEGLRKSVADILQDVRRIAAELRPTVLAGVRDLGLPTLLEFLAKDFYDRAQFPVHMDLDLDETRVDAARAETAYHVVREALSNVIQHAEAVRAVVTGRIDGDILAIQVMDDGKGMPADDHANPRTLGLLGIGERVRAWGGGVSLHSQAGAGTTLDIRIPLAPPGATGAPS